jgi:predicted protein tyrosine phosphatase
MLKQKITWGEYENILKKHARKPELLVVSFGGSDGGARGVKAVEAFSRDERLVVKYSGWANGFEKQLSWFELRNANIVVAMEKSDLKLIQLVIDKANEPYCHCEFWEIHAPSLTFLKPYVLDIPDKYDSREQELDALIKQRIDSFLPDALEKFCRDEIERFISSGGAL